ncbi:MAG: TetR/AcrR family transcriptional regulator [Spirochaetales bacterium]|nr:TetR/AcrR family transcriptional regulator [Spirochaetales bacterium]
MATDRRVRYTKKVIKDSFLTLLHDHPINQMTVKALCLEADINRATFYRHYNDIYDLFEEIENELCQEASLDTVGDLIDIKELTIIYKNQGFYKEFFRTSLLSSLIKNSHKYLYEKEREKARHSEGFDEKKTKYAFDYFIYGVEGLLKDWVEKGCSESPEEFAQILKEVTAH